LTCIEEIDHGLHPHILDRLVELLRQASNRTQFLIATHSPALVNRLTPDELIVCERGEDAASRIPAIDPATVRDMERELHGEIGSGSCGFPARSEVARNDRHAGRVAQGSCHSRRG
jgi:hypothetical protein